MLLTNNEDEGTQSQLKILSVLQEIKAPFGFNEILNRANLNPHILNKWLKRFVSEKSANKINNRKY